MGVEGSQGLGLTLPFGVTLSRKLPGLKHNCNISTSLYPEVQPLDFCRSKLGGDRRLRKDSFAELQEG